MIGAIVSLGLSALSAFVSMIFSSMAAGEKDLNKAKSYAKWSAIISGISVIMMVIAIFFIYFSKPLAATISTQIANLQTALKSYSA
jgi:Na+-driven multidrug efflux pump